MEGMRTRSAYLQNGLLETNLMRWFGGFIQGVLSSPLSSEPLDVLGEEQGDVLHQLLPNLQVKVEVEVEVEVEVQSLEVQELQVQVKSS